MADDVLEGYRLSPQQMQFWALADGPAAYRSECVLALDGPVRHDAIRTALQHVVSRHEILRTSFRTAPGVDLVLQVIADETDVVVHPDGAQPVIDLASGPVLHATLSDAGHDRTLLRLSCPAVCADAASMTVLFGELAAAYESVCRGTALPSDAVVQYADFAEFQNEILESDERHEAMEYWAKLAATAEMSPRLPFEREPDGRPSMRTATREIGTAHDLERLSGAGVPAETLLLTAWQVLLWRMCGESEEITVDARLDGRGYAALRQAIGCFSRTVPVRGVLDGDLTFEQAARRTHHAVSDARRWLDFHSLRSGAQAGDRISPRRSALVFAFEEWPSSRRAADVVMTVTDLVSHAEDGKLVVVCGMVGGRLRATLRYDQSIYDAQGAQELLERFEILLADAARRPSARISELALLSPSERGGLLGEQGRPIDVDNLCVHELFERHAARSPEAVALTFDRTDLTYGSVNAHADRLAGRLQAAGVRPDAVVGLLVERSAEMVVGLLGILKAGAAYLPLDPALPPVRLELFMTEAKTEVIVAQRRFLHALSEFDAQVVCLEDDGDAVVPQRIAPTVGPRNAAYVTFTSGSSGTPKGVVVEHGHLRNYVDAVVAQLGLEEASSFATVTNLGSDLGNTAVYAALCTGGRLHVLSHDVATDAGAMAAQFARVPVDCMKIAASHLAELVAAADDPQSILPRRKLVIGGETLNWGTARVFQAHAPHCRIFNHYGPTETTVGVTTFDVSDALGASHPSATVPIGLPLPNSAVYVLNGAMEPVPPGVIGEVYIGGGNVARGYVNRPDLTAERFLPDPFSGRPGARLYRTGDRARRHRDGTLEFVGRVDRQVKLRGYRIELGEIEAALRRHRGVRECAAVVRGESGLQKIVGYVAAGNGDRPSSRELVEFLRQRLPEYMLPAHVVVLDKLPLTANGKVDHRALPQPEHVQSEAASSGPPRNDVEEKLASIFQSTLGLERVGIHDDFFEIGGHSLLATRLLARTREAFGTNVSLRSVFESPTVAELAQVIEGLLAAPDAANGRAAAEAER